MRIEQLEAFVEVASSKSISIAAENLYITQPSLSRSMKLLEDELGVTLFIRSSNGVRLSSEGQALLPDIQEALNQINRLKEHATSLQAIPPNTFQGTFNVYVFQSIADSILIYGFEELQRAFPEIKFVFTIPELFDYNQYQFPDLSNYDLFLGLSIGNSLDAFMKDNSLKIAPVFTDTFSIVINKEHPLANRKIIDILELLDYEVILHNYDFSDNFYDELIDPQVSDKKLQILLRSNNSRVITKLLLTTSAVLITNNIFAANDYAANQNLIIIPIKNFQYRCFCMFDPNNPSSACVPKIIDIFQKVRLKLSLK